MESNRILNCHFVANVKFNSNNALQNTVIITYLIFPEIAVYSLVNSEVPNNHIEHNKSIKWKISQLLVYSLPPQIC